VPPEEQLRRLTPVLERLHGLGPETRLSVDTRSAVVAREAIRRGVAIINDVSAGTHDPDLLPAVAEAGVSLILMHMSPDYPATPAADDPDIVLTVREFLGRRVEAALRAGVALSCLAVDPGIGFGKTMADNWRLAWRAREIGQGLLVVLGVSRKRFLETAPPPDVDLPPDWSDFVTMFQGSARHPRDAATTALTVLAARRGVAIHRVHQVRAVTANVNTPT
jgi:dihydropteroate synthase